LAGRDCVLPVERETEVLADLARQVTLVVGDGCLVRVADPSDGGLRAVAADHRDADRRRAFLELLRAPPLDRAGAWPTQAIERGCAVRLPDISVETLLGAGVPHDERVTDVVFLPLAQQAVLTAVRDRVAGRYSALERQEMQGLVGQASRDLSAPTTIPGRSKASDHSPQPLSEPSHLVDAVSAGVWVVDQRGRILSVNEHGSEMIGLPAERVLGMPFAEFLDESPPGLPADFIGGAGSDRRLIGADGEVRWVHARSRPLFGTNGNPSGAAITLFDVSERREREVRLRTRLDANRALAEFAELLILEDAPDRLLTRAAELLADQLDAPAVGVGEVARDLSEVTTLALAGSDVDNDLQHWRGTHPLPAGSVTRAAIKSGEVIGVSDFEAQGIYRRGPLGNEARVRSIGAAPLAEGRGYLTAVSRQPHAIGADEIELLGSVARLLTAAGAL
jgi:PAS domain S-box-containing protein